MYPDPSAYFSSRNEASGFAFAKYFMASFLEVVLHPRAERIALGWLRVYSWSGKR